MNLTRALVCELVASKILRRFDEDNRGPRGLLLLSNILVAGFEPFQNAPEEVIQSNSHAIHWMTQKRGGYERKLTALEIAIISEGKSFLASTACQKVVDAIYKGRVVYTPTSFFDIIPDHYKRKSVSLYDPKNAPLLNQYRLVVPRTRSVIEVLQFAFLLFLYILVMSKRDATTLPARELVFIIYALGWGLEQLASILEHGWHVYTENLWAFLDVTFIFIYGVYLVIRLHGFTTGNLDTAQQALNILAVGAPVLIPRLAFNFMSENMLFVCLRAMMYDFINLTFLAVWCFGGFLLSMFWLANGAHTTVTISKWMMYVWFGLDATGVQRSGEFNRLLGPVEMVAFAFLGNTLFLTILVSMLSNTFATIVANATAEIQFRRAVLTFECVKSDAIFAYPPPLNVLALLIMLPLKFTMTPRWFHKINVAVVRTFNWPLLLLISVLERKSLWANYSAKGISGNKAGAAKFKKPSKLAFWGFSRFSAHGDLQAVFESEPPSDVPEEIDDGTEQGPRDVQGIVVGARNEEEDGQVISSGSKKDSSSNLKSLSTKQLREMMEEAVDGADVRNRLEELELTTKRIETLLIKLADNPGSRVTEETE